MIGIQQQQSIVPPTATIMMNRKRSITQVQAFPATENISEECTKQEIKKRRVIQTKSVQFAPILAEPFPVQSTTGKSDWIQDEDILRFHGMMRDDVVYLCNLTKEGRLHEFDATEHCSVGIERYCCSSNTRDARAAWNRQRIHAVIRLLQAQEKLGVKDPEAIRAVSQRYSKESRTKAVALAASLWKRP